MNLLRLYQLVNGVYEYGDNMADIQVYNSDGYKITGVTITDDNKIIFNIEEGE